MEMILTRKLFTNKSTIGELSVDGAFECYTLEDVVRPFKIAKETAIPMGRYAVHVTYSNRFKKRMPLLLNVPHFQGIRIHPGNTAKDTDGCILVGKTKVHDFIGQSRDAYQALFRKIDAAWNRNEAITIEIRGGITSGQDGPAEALQAYA